MRKLLVVAALTFACAKKQPNDDAPTTAASPATGAPHTALPSQTFITTVSGARIRATATADGTEVVRLPIGAKLESDATEGEWHRVSTADGAKGYIAGSVTKQLDKGADSYIKVFTDRLTSDKLTFPDYADLYGAIKHAQDETPDHIKKAEFELLRQRTLKKTLAAGEQSQPPYKGFLNQYSADVVYSEPGGEWLPHLDPTWKAAEAYTDTPSGEAIAWEAATTYPPGECEGFFGCALDVTNMTWGHYLKLFPKGPHAAEALDHYAQLEPPEKLDEVVDYDGETWQAFDDGVKLAADTIARCDTEARKGAEAMIATTKRNESFLFRGKKVPPQKKK